jgi:hypothetical protein
VPTGGLAKGPDKRGIPQLPHRDSIAGLAMLFATMLNPVYRFEHATHPFICDDAQAWPPASGSKHRIGA